jgi:glycine cleavage system H lipoate-binding protein
MAFIEKFLGKRVEIPEDRRYYIRQGLWAKPDGQYLVFGFSEPGLVLMGGLNDLDPLVSDGQKVEKGESVIFAITGRILYLDAPIKGDILFHHEIKQKPAMIADDLYDKGWLFKIKPDEGLEVAYQSLDTAQTYFECLKATEGARNPDGLKGGVSGICKAVYTSIREQKL